MGRGRRRPGRRQLLLRRLRRPHRSRRHTCICRAWHSCWMLGVWAGLGEKADIWAGGRRSCGACDGLVIPRGIPASVGHPHAIPTERCHGVVPPTAVGAQADRGKRRGEWHEQARWRGRRRASS
jgi:hypothetical protein